MGTVAAAVTRNGLAADLVSTMLESMRHRAHDGFGIAAETWAKYSGKSPPTDLPASNCAVGCCRSKILPSDLIQPFLTSEGAAAIDGRFYGANNRISLTTRLEGLVNGRRNTIVDGAYAVVLISRHQVVAFSDPIGLKPLYCGSIDKGFAFASELRALSKIQVQNVRKLLPSEVFTVGSNARPRVLQRTSQARPPFRMSFESCSERLLDVLRTATKLMLEDVNNVCVSFSGGLDSAVTAWLAQDAGCNVRLVSVGLGEDSEELKHAKAIASQMGWPLKEFAYTRDQVEHYVRRVLWLIEEPNLMKVSVAVPLHWAAESVSRSGATILLTGQGSDELFGGYRRFSRILDAQGWVALRRELRRAVKDSHAVNFARDEKAVGPLRVELRSPFTMADVIDFGLRIPAEYKVRAGDDLMRKWILRSVGRLMKLPGAVTERRKRAIQHATGVERVIRDLANRAGKSPDAYLAGVFNELRGLDEMP